MNETYSSAVCDCASPSPPPSEEGPFTLSLDRLAGRLARLLRAPLAVILLDDDGVFWSDDGILLDRASCPWMSLLRALGREVAIASRPLVLPDLQRERPMAEAEGIAAYLGVPLLTPEGHAVGSLGVADREPRVWTEDEEETLGDFAALVAAALAGRSSDHERRRIEQEHDRLLAREREARARAERFEERFRAFLANCSEGIWCFEGEPLRVDLPEDEQLAHFYRHGYLSECNDAMARMYGFEHASQLLGRPLGEFLNPADPRSEIFLRGLIRSGYRLIDAEAHETDREGRPKVFLISLVGIIEDGLLRRVWGTQRDITAARQAELALRASEERHRIISELMSDYTSSYAVQPDGTLVPEWIAGAFQRITGYTLEEITERGWQILIHPEDRPLVAQHVERLLAGEAHVSEHRFITKAGEVIWVRNGARPVRDEATGRVVRLIGASQDITERKRAEQAMQAAREAAEAANRAKDRFLAVLSHELRTPLTPVLAETSARLDDPATPAEVRPMLDLIRRNIELEARLIDDLLDINRIASGKMTLERQAVDLHLVIQRALESCQAALRGAGLHLELDLRAEVHHVEGDPVRLQQIIWNLLKNACKFTPEGGTITVRSRREAGPRPGDWLVVVEVSDTGIGIDPAVLPTIFEAFEQGDPALSRRHDGLG
ncbi:MAG: PAS domain S-box protein, partial [Isosphaeraceae bacterium]|nr:PAS domain S-box protein [Isosphaeraceae bacterium]